jgi:uncharacterized protein YbcC (UPF0753/DUF2309 family)
LWVAKEIDAEIYPKIMILQPSHLSKLQYIWLKAWKKAGKRTCKVLDSKQIVLNNRKKERVPDAQMVFCIDTRSELIRRHVENKGHYETFGYAGFLNCDGL